MRVEWSSTGPSTSFVPSENGTGIRQLFHEANEWVEETKEVFATFFGLSREELAAKDEGF